MSLNTGLARMADFWTLVAHATVDFDPSICCFSSYVYYCDLYSPLHKKHDTKDGD